MVFSKIMFALFQTIKWASTRRANLVNSVKYLKNVTGGLLTSEKENHGEVDSLESGGGQSVPGCCRNSHSCDEICRESHAERVLLQRPLTLLPVP